MPDRQSRVAAGLRLLVRRSRRSPSTTAAPTWASRCTGARVENGLLTCHWHHARFDLASGGTLDPFADDVRAHEVEVDGSDVIVVLRPRADPAGHHLHRLEEGLEQGLTLVMAKAVLGLFEALGPDEERWPHPGGGRLRRP